MPALKDEIKTTKIKDLVVSRLYPHSDDRGFLYEVLRNNDPHFTRFGQVYVVGNWARGNIRAFHKHEILWDWFSIVHGAAKFVFKDDRKDSPTYGQLESMVISSRTPSLIAVPPRVYHGWMSLEDDTLMLSIGSEVYNAEKPDEVRIPPDSFGDVWTVKGR